LDSEYDITATDVCQHHIEWLPKLNGESQHGYIDTTIPGGIHCVGGIYFVLEPDSSSAVHRVSNSLAVFYPSDPSQGQVTSFIRNLERQIN
jgi:hypothetical protein